MAAAARDAGADSARRRRARTVARHPQAQTEGAAESEGIVNAPMSFLKLFKGANFGKMLVQLGERERTEAT